MTASFASWVSLALSPIPKTKSRQKDWGGGGRGKAASKGKCHCNQVPGLCKLVQVIMQTMCRELTLLNRDPQWLRFPCCRVCLSLVIFKAAYWQLEEALFLVPAIGRERLSSQTGASFA